METLAVLWHILMVVCNVFLVWWCASILYQAVSGTLVTKDRRADFGALALLALTGSFVGFTNHFAALVRP